MEMLLMTFLPQVFLSAGGGGNGSLSTILSAATEFVTWVINKPPYLSGGF